MNTLTKLDAIRQFFGSAGHPVTTKELTDFKKADPKGFDEVATAALDVLEKTA